MQELLKLPTLNRIGVVRVGSYWWVTEARIPRLRFESWASAMYGARAWHAKRHGDLTNQHEQEQA